MPRPAEIRYPTSDSYPRPKAPSPRGLRPQAVGEFTVMGFFTLSNSSINPNFPHIKIQISPPLPSLMILSKVSESFTREASGICSSLVWMLSPTSS